MATIKITKVLCDVCGNEDSEAQKYEIRQGTRRRAIDLCVKDAKQVESLMEAGAKTAAGKRRGRPPKVTTMDEIDSAKSA